MYIDFPPKVKPNFVERDLEMVKVAILLERLVHFTSSNNENYRRCCK